MDPCRFGRRCAFSHVGGQVERLSCLEVHANGKVAFRADRPTKIFGQRVNEIVGHTAEGDQIAQEEGQAFDPFLVAEIGKFQPFGIHTTGHGHFNLGRERFDHGATVQPKQGVVVVRGVLKKQP